jgi:signal transduction histidine kinase
MDEIYKNTLNMLSDGIMITNNLYQIIFINEKLKNDIRSIYENDVIGLYITTLFNEFSILEKNKIYKNKKISLSFFKKNIGGNMLYASLSDIDNENIYSVYINTILNNNLQYYLFIFENVFDKMNNINDTQKKQNNFVAFLSHELRNPLQSIVLSNFLLNKELMKINLTDKIKQHLSLIHI